MNKLYELLLQRGWTFSKRDFSTYWLGKSPSYFATTGGGSEGAMLTVMRKLFEEGRWLTALRVLHMIVVGRRLHDDEAAA